MGVQLLALDAALLICTPTPPSVWQLCIAPYILVFLVFTSPRFSPHSHGRPKVTAINKASKLHSFSLPMMGGKTFVVAR
jgi:hypothetical protein